MVSYLSVLAKTVFGESETHGVQLGELLVTFNLLLVTLAVFASLPLTQFWFEFHNHKNNNNNFIILNSLQAQIDSTKEDFFILKIELLKWKKD